VGKFFEFEIQVSSYQNKISFWSNRMKFVASAPGAGPVSVQKCKYKRWPKNISEKKR
jgi:hypothetical protein